MRRSSSGARASVLPPKSMSAAALPESLPIGFAGGADFVGRKRGVSEFLGGEFAGEIELPAAQQNAMPARGLGARAAGPVQADRVAVGIHLPARSWPCRGGWQPLASHADRGPPSPTAFMDGEP